MTYEELRDVISNHRLMLEIRPPCIPENVRCGCGKAFAVPEEHTNHLAEIIVIEEERIKSDATRQA